MVFESIAFNVFDQLLGKYFEKLDSSQLKLGIWGGDVILNNLKLRNSALDDVGPFRVVVGQLGSLTMKIPWKSLYTAPVILNLKDLHVLIVPSHSTKYDEREEEVAAQEVKLKEILRFEEVRLKELARAQGDSKEVEDGFTEKMLAQIVKNVQITIESIHIRYEDFSSNPGRPFSFGVVLNKLAAETTTADWKPQIITEAVHVIHKLVDLNGFSLYWNSSSDIINSQRDSPEQMIKKMKDFMSDQNINHVLGPLKSEARVKLVPNPDRGDVPYSLPKMLVNVVMQELALGLTDGQFQDLIHFMESLEYMYRSQRYRKHRPVLTQYKGNSKIWWKFAYKCVVEAEARRRLKNWDWKHMKSHRELCKAYGKAYYQKKSSKKSNPEVESTVAHCENVLDIFNIILVRKQVEVRLTRLKELEALQPTQQPRSVFSWSRWFGAEEAASTGQGSTSQELALKLKEELTSEEKTKLYSAIDYQEDASPLIYPPEFEEYVLNFQLCKLKLTIKEDSREARFDKILDLVATDLFAKLRTRPFKSGLQLGIELNNVFAVGVKEKGKEPPIILRMNEPTEAKKNKLLNILFESHPLSKEVDQLVQLRAQPLEIIYDSETAQELSRCFTLPHQVQFSRLQAAAVTTFEEWKLQSASGLQMMLDQRGEIDVDVELAAPVVIIPEGGHLQKKGSVLVVNLGSMLAKSRPRKKAGTGKLNFEQIKELSYDKLDVTLRDFHVMLALPDEDYRSWLGDSSMIQHSNLRKAMGQPSLINYKELNICIHLSLVQDKPQFERCKIQAHLPLLDVTLTKGRLLELTTLLATLPLPVTESDLLLDGGMVSRVEEMPDLFDSAAVSKITYTDIAVAGRETDGDPAAAEFTDIMVSLGIDCVKVTVTRNVNKGLVPLTSVELSRLETKIISKTYRTDIEARVGGLSMEMFQHKYPSLVGPMYLLKTPIAIAGDDGDRKDSYLLHVKVSSINPKCPKSLATTIKQRVYADISKLDIVLHLQALKQLTEFYEDCVSYVSEAVVKDPDTISISSKTSESALTPRKKASRIQALRRAVAKKYTDPNDILLQLDAHLEELTVQFSSEKVDLIKTVLEKLDLSFQQQVKESTLDLTLTNVDVLNLSPTSVYKHLIRVDSDKVMDINIVMLEDGRKGKHYLNMDMFDVKVTLKANSPNLVYIAPVVMDVLAFIDAFQTAKEAVIEASRAAADLARGNLEQVRAGSLRVLLDLKLKAPKVIVPRNERVFDAFVADLGELTLRNSFTKVEDPSWTKPAITDDIRIALNNVTVSRVRLGPTQNIISEVSVIDPVSLTLGVTRSLSSEWCTQIPDITVGGRLNSVSMTLSNDDYNAALAMSLENLAAPGKLERLVALPPKSKSGIRGRLISMSKIIISPPPDKRDAGSPAHKKARTLPAVREEATVKLRVEFEVAKLALVLHNGSSHLENNQGTVARCKEQAFADFSVQTIGFKHESRSNGDMTVDISVHDVSLLDCRPGDRAIKTLIHSKNETDNLMGNSLLQVSFKTGVNQSGPTLAVQTVSLRLILCVDYLVLLTAFVTPDTATQANPLVKESPVKMKKLPPVREGSGEDDVFFGAGEASGPSQDFKIQLNTAATEIILVEDMSTLHANALLLGCEVSSQMVLYEDRINLTGTVNNVRLSTCYVGAQSQYKKMAEVLSPTSMYMVLNTSKGAGTLVDVNVSKVFIRVNASTVGLLLRIAKGLTASVLKEEGSCREVNYEDLWKEKYITDRDYWFLNPSTAVEVGTDIVKAVSSSPQKEDPTPDSSPVRQRLTLESGSIAVTFESEGGQNSLPLLLVESQIDFEAQNWTRMLSVSGRMKLEAAYYNVKYGLWDVLIEPVATKRQGKILAEPWELYFEYNELPRKDRNNGTGKYSTAVLKSTDLLELTVAKSTLEAISILTKEFQMTSKDLTSKAEVATTAPYVVANELGTQINLDLRGSSLACCRQGTLYEDVILCNGTSANLGFMEPMEWENKSSSLLRSQEDRDKREIRIHIEAFDVTAKLPINSAARRYYPLPGTGQESGEAFGVICDVTVKDCSKILTIRSILQIVNELPVAIEVFIKDEATNKYTCIGTAGGNGIFSVPLGFLYANSYYFAPKGYKVSPISCTWTGIMKQKKYVSYLRFDPSGPGPGSPLFMKVVGEVKEALHESTNQKSASSKYCSIYLRPPLTIHNLLPVRFTYHTDFDLKPRVVEAGTAMSATNVQLLDSQEITIAFLISGYQGSSWMAELRIQRNAPKFSVCEFVTPKGKPKLSLSLGIHRELVNESDLVLHVYAPFWMANRTGMDLYYKGDDGTEEYPTIFHHSFDTPDPLMFSFGGKGFFRKNKAAVRIQNGDWSEEFSVDVAGSGGTVVCKSPRYEFQVGLEIQPTSWGLTKAIIFTPRFYFVNQCPYPVCIHEGRARSPDVLQELAPKSCVPFWPYAGDTDVVVSVKGTAERTKPIRYDRPHHTLLQLQNKYGGIHVDVNLTDNSTIITFGEYVTGHAPALLINATPDCLIKYSEQGSANSGDRILLPGAAQYLAWEDPMGSRALVWSDMNNEASKNVDQLQSDAQGEFTYMSQSSQLDTTCFWISFLDGLQRVLLFTEKAALVENLGAVQVVDHLESEYSIDFHGLGLSLVDGDKGHEVLYARVGSSDVIWRGSQNEMSEQFKALSSQESSGIEAAYSHYFGEKNRMNRSVMLDCGLEVNFNTMSIVKPVPRKLRRDFQPGVWIHYKKYLHANHLHAKLFHLQIDSQLPNTVFPVVLAPVAPPKSIATQNETLKPFAEVSVIQRITANSSVTQFKYVQALIQEFLVRADVGFINAVADVFVQNVKPAEALKYFNKQLEEYSQTPEEVFKCQISTKGQKHFYDFLHFSPLKVHLSFSLEASSQLSNNFLNLFLQSMKTTFTDVQDVTFQLACLELHHKVLSGKELTNELRRHYQSQALKQLYVIVFGLDIIGNPYGLLLGAAEGVKAFFYEPVHGAIQGPEEFAKGLILGSKTLFGNTVGGAVGALSKITGTLGKGIAALTFDEEYKQNRRAATAKTDNIGSDFAQSSKGLVKGFFDGVTGVVTKPVQGAQKGGFGGLFKGIGQGAVGLFVKPVTGIADFTSGSLDAVKRVTTSTSTDNIHRIRPPRPIPLDSIVQPYMTRSADRTQGTSKEMR